MCKKTRIIYQRFQAHRQNYFGLPSNSQQLDDADAIIVNEQTEEFKGVDDIISDK